MRRGGLIDKAAHEKITMRHSGAQGLVQIAPLTAEDVNGCSPRSNPIFL
jgi:hypothetical protein